MPIKVTDQGWVKTPAAKPRKSNKKADPVDLFRGPLAYITGRPEFKAPVKKQSIKQLMIEAATAPPIQPYIEERSPRERSHRSKRVPSEPVPSKTRHRTRRDSYEEADAEIHRPSFIPDDMQSRRSASPIGSRRGGAAASVRSRKDPRPHSVYDEGYDTEPRSRSRRHVSSSVYEEPLRSTNRHSYHREREVERYTPPQAYRQPAMAPALQPIIIYSTPPMGGCGGHHGCQSAMFQQQYQYPNQQCFATPHPMLQMAAMPQIEAAPRPAASIVSSASSSKSRPMSYKWHTATQPLKI